jgi:SAM-dependent methyltransferase
LSLAPDSPTEFYEARTAEKYASSDNPEMVRLVRRIVEWCEIVDGSRLMDFGCFDGYLISRIGMDRPIEAVGIDISLRALELARTNSQNGRAWIAAGDAGLPLGDAQFDVVLCSEILEHVPDFDGTLAEMARVLKPGGRLYATMPNDLARVWGPMRGVCRIVDHVEGHLRRMRLEDFCAAGERLGLQVGRSQYRGFVFSAIWYRTLIYSPRVKERGMAMISAEQSRLSVLLQRLAYSGMRLYLWGDSLFHKSPRSMGFDVLFIKPGDGS